MRPPSGECLFGRRQARAPVQGPWVTVEILPCAGILRQTPVQAQSVTSDSIHRGSRGHAVISAS